MDGSIVYMIGCLYFLSLCNYWPVAYLQVIIQLLKYINNHQINLSATIQTENNI